MITPGDLRNMPMFHGRSVRRGVKVPMRFVALNGYNDNMFTASDSLRPTDPAPLMNDYGALFKYGKLGETVPAAGAAAASPTGLMAKVKQFKWPLIVGGAIAAGIVGFIIYRKRTRS